MFKRFEKKIVAVAMSNFVALQLPPRVVGKIHSKFRQGVNILLGDMLIFLSSARKPLMVVGISVGETELQELLANVDVGEQVVKNGDIIRIYSRYSIIEICSSAVTEIDFNIPRIDFLISDLRHSMLYKELKMLQLEKQLGLKLDTQTKKYCQQLVNLTNLTSWEQIQVIEYFTGRGQGLTPAGDDILLGFSLLISMERQRFVEWLECLAAVLSRRLTTEVSLGYMNALIRGYANHNCVNLIKCLESDDITKVQQTIGAVYQIGHTSGKDILYGFSLALEFFIKNTVRINSGEGENSGHKIARNSSNNAVAF